MTYASLNDCKDELQISYSITSDDQELNALLQRIDDYVNMRLNHYTSLPVQDAIGGQLADTESRWVANRFRFRRATPSEQIDLQKTIDLIETQFQNFLDANFRQHFQGVDYQTDKGHTSTRPGYWGEGAGAVHN
jgi:hypothetical protein